jgi:hypothetical protein
VPVTNILKLFSKFKALDFNHLSMAQYFIWKIDMLLT